MRYAYLHGFGSSPLTKKGVRLAGALAEKGLVLERPDLNRPSFAKLSPRAALDAITEMAGGDTWSIMGSSMGGYLAARWASLHPEQVKKLVLLCPGFELASRWPAIVGPERMARWKREGSLLFPDGEGRPVPVHYAFYEEGRTLPERPRVTCPARIYHGVHDEVVPIETSRAYVEENPHVELVELDDDHALLASIDRILRETMTFFGIG